MAVDPLWAKASTQAPVLAGKGGLRAALINAASNYGDPSSLFASGSMIDPATGQPVSLAEFYGIGQNDVSGAASNPYSTLHQLGDTLTSDRHNIVGGLAARGLENSGAMAASQLHESQAAGQRNYAAQQGLQSTLSGIGDKYAGLISGAYQTLMGQAANDPTIPAAPDAAPAPPAPAPPPPAVLPTGAQIPGATQATANWNLNPGGYNSLAPQNNVTGIAMPKPPKPKPILVGRAGGNQ